VRASPITITNSIVPAIHPLDQVGLGEPRLRARLQGPQIHQGLVDAPFPARADQFCQRCLARRQVEMTVGAHPNEFAGTNNLKFQGHKIRKEQQEAEETETDFSALFSPFAPVQILGSFHSRRGCFMCLLIHFPVFYGILFVRVGCSCFLVLFVLLRFAVAHRRPR
jgi:hypothetical protein